MSTILTQTRVQRNLLVGGRWPMAPANARFTRCERSEWPVCNRLLGRAQRGDGTPVNRVLGPTSASASVLTTQYADERT